MGHGKGYYDKCLENAKPETPLIALAFECQMFDEIPVETEFRTASSGLRGQNPVNTVIGDIEVVCTQPLGPVMEGVVTFALVLGTLFTGWELRNSMHREARMRQQIGVASGAFADILIVDGNPLEDIGAIGAREKWLDAAPRGVEVEPIRLIMKDGKIYKNTLE